MKRLPFLDWTRGLAVLIMIQCHVFNSLVRVDLRESAAYILSQFVGGMAAVLFLFLAGVTFAFQMDSADRREPLPSRRWLNALRRAGYLFALAYLFRFSNWALARRAPWTSMLKVDILNCMGLAMLVFSVMALWPAATRIRMMTLAGLTVAAAAPLVSALNWSQAPQLVRDYLMPSRTSFAFFPWAAYLAFGIAAGALLKRIDPERLERTMQWAVLVGFALIGGGQYFSNLPYSLYARSDFWTDSPGLVIIRLGLSLLAAAVAFLWTGFCAGPGWSWMQTLGKTSLLVYWVHILLVYGALAEHWKTALSVVQATATTIAVTAFMVALAEVRLRWSARSSAKARRRDILAAEAR